MHILAISNWKSDLGIRLQEALKVYEHYSQVVAARQSGSKPLKFSNYELVEHGILRFNGRIYIPSKNELNKVIL